VLWYYAHSTHDPVDSIKGDAAMQTFQDELNSLTKRIQKGAVENEDVRDRLAERRVQLGLSLARRFPSKVMKQRLESALNDYSDIFTPADLDALVAERPWTDVSAITPAVKRRAHAFTPLKEAKRLSDTLNPKPQHGKRRISLPAKETRGRFPEPVTAECARPQASG
jgi:hypothetical protein